MQKSFADGNRSRIDVPVLMDGSANGQFHSHLREEPVPNRRRHQSARGIPQYPELFDRDEPPHPSIQILLLDDDKRFRFVVPDQHGDPRQGTTGLRQRAGDGDIIVLARAPTKDQIRTIYHELTHHFLERHLKSPPLWLNEGLAEYFEETEFRKDKLIVGASHHEPRHLLAPHVTLGLTELFRVTRSSEEYLDAKKAKWFYVQSYAFVHFLLHGRYRNGFKQYVQALATGPANIEKYVGVPLSKLEDSFSSYLRSYRWKSLELPLPRAVTSIKVSGEEIRPADAEIKVVEVLLWGGHVQQARERLQQITGIDPDSPYLARVLNLLQRVKPRRPEVSRPTTVDSP